jgi:hypothetical protein
MIAYAGHARLAAGGEATGAAGVRTRWPLSDLAPPASHPR